MNSTKQRILATSLKLFNEEGLPNVSLRRIADELNISVGNLTYHFNKKEVIEETLYYELVALIDKEFGPIPDEELSLKILKDLTGKLFSYLYEYRFIFIDLVYIMRTNDTIRAHYSELVTLRKIQCTHFFTQLIPLGILREEELPNEYENLYIRNQLTFDFFLSSLVITKEGINEVSIEKHQTIYLQSIYPYLTEKGKVEFFKVIS